MHPAQVLLILACSLGPQAAAHDASGPSAANFPRTENGLGVTYSIRCGGEATRTFQSGCYAPYARCDGSRYVAAAGYAFVCQACQCDRQLRGSGTRRSRDRREAEPHNPMITPAPNMNSKRDPAAGQHPQKAKTKTVRFDLNEGCYGNGYGCA
ncbi:hypothetical protein O9K51_01605 [Purpureocillium lavendulum]|uniref:Uncharacterized protein n=1 Tax=Purpureocillium lavendulum TaxID=1247861 RepID=A0AB34G5F4_9HYPO|nr:hypothetical protein O9K51_01605 [Purpureocillium lavendulum]